MVSNLPSKLASGISSVRKGTFDFDQSGHSGLGLPPQQPKSTIKTQRTDKNKNQNNKSEQIFRLSNDLN